MFILSKSKSLASTSLITVVHFNFNTNSSHSFSTKSIGNPFKLLDSTIFRRVRKNRNLTGVYFDSHTAAATATATEASTSVPISTDSTSDLNCDTPSYRQNELRLTCTELDSSGNLNIRHGRFSKSNLCASLGLQARDLRKLDGTLKNQLPSVLIRPRAVLINFDLIRAVIKWDQVTFFNGKHDVSHLQKLLLQDLQTKLKSSSASVNSSLPFEFVVIETIFQTTLQGLQDELDSMGPSIEKHLTILERFVHWDKLKTMLECKKRVALFHERVSNLRNCIAEVLESDADMAAMYLTAKSSSSNPRPVYAHDEMELLLESYLKIAEEIVSRVQLLASNIQSTEDIVNIGLVGQRNELLLLELKLGIGTFAASMGAFGASVLGMNLVNGFERDPNAFWLTLGGLVSISIFAFTSSWRRMLQLIRKY